MMLVMSSDVDSGMWMLIIKALVVAEYGERTPVRYRLSMRSSEWLAEIGRSARGL